MKLSNKISRVIVSFSFIAVFLVAAFFYILLEYFLGIKIASEMKLYSLLAALFILGVLVFITSISSLQLIKREVIEPINSLMSTIRKYTNGYTDQRSHLLSEDEIGQLAKEFNQMADKVEEANNQLNQEIKKRTTELSEKVKDLEDVKMATINILEDLNEDKTKIEQSKAKDEAVLDSIGDGLVVTDNDFNVLMINNQGEALLGWDLDDMQGKNWLSFVEPIDEKNKEKVAVGNLPISVAIKKGERIKQSNLMYHTKGGNLVPVSVTASPIILKDETVGVVIVFRDITHEREVDRAKTEFVSLASHQLRTPLSAINWYAEMLIAGDAGQVNDEQKNYIEEIYASNQRMVALVDSLLNVSRIDLGTFAVDPEKTDILEVCDSVISELKPQIEEKKLVFKKDYMENMPHFMLDPKLMRIVFQNLISNAVKYTPEGGTISVGISKDVDNLLLKISDTGYGVPKDQQAKLFTKLFRADNVREKATDGTGLGLYIVKSIIEQAGGAINFESEENKGTTFNIYLPLSGMSKKVGTRGLS